MPTTEMFLMPSSHNRVINCEVLKKEPHLDKRSINEIENCRLPAVNMEKLPVQNSKFFVHENDKRQCI